MKPRIVTIEIELETSRTLVDLKMAFESFCRRAKLLRTQRVYVNARKPRRLR